MFHWHCWQCQVKPELVGQISKYIMPLEKKKMAANCSAKISLKWTWLFIMKLFAQFLDRSSRYSLHWTLVGKNVQVQYRTLEDCRQVQMQNKAVVDRNAQMQRGSWRQTLPGAAESSYRRTRISAAQALYSRQTPQVHTKALVDRHA